MNKTFFITVPLFCIITVCSFWAGVKSQELVVIRLQADVIQAQEAHKESLRKEAEYLEKLNSDFGKTYDAEEQRWISEIKAEVRK